MANKHFKSKQEIFDAIVEKSKERFFEKYRAVHISDMNLESSMKKRRVVIVIVLLFIAAFYWVEFSPWSSNALKVYNEGYGTFDMKFYDTTIVYKVLSTMKEEGVKLSYKYYIGDFLFVLAFGAFQIMLSLYAYSCTKHKSHKKIRE